MSLELTILRALLGPVLGSVAKKAWAAVLGSDDERTLERLVRQALRTAVESDEYLASLPPEDQLHVQSVLSHALAELDEKQLIRLNDESKESVVAVLATAARSGRFDLSTLGTDPFFLISRFLAALREGVQTEAKRHGSPLFEFTTQEHLTAIRQALFALVARFDRAGDAGDVFVGRYQRLRDQYLPPWDIFARHDPHRFVGREWLSSQIDEFINHEQCGYFVLEADAGLGKSAFFTNLVRTRGYLHHFVQPGPASRVDAALKSLAAQLVRVTGSESYLPASLDVSELFQKVLIEAAGRLRPEQRLVLVVDGLDEAETPPGLNPLGLPSFLPPGAFCVVSHRPGVRWVNVAVRRKLCHLRADDDRNLADMHRYLHRAADRPGVAAALAGAGYSADQFVVTLADKCKGVWIYLHYVVEEIERGDRSPLELDSLPHGVWQYYAQFWNRWQDQHADDWDGEHLPLLATIGAVQESATLQLLCALADLPPHPRLRRLLQERWRPFLATPRGEEPLYSVYHISLREFLAGQLMSAEWEQLTDTEQSRLRETVGATQQVHSRIADRYLTAWGGLDAGLPDLAAEPSLAQCDGGYPLRALATHLLATGRDEDLHKLLACGHQNRNVWYAAHESAGETQGFLNDVALARRALDRTTGTRPGGPANSDIVSRRVRYALVASSVAAVFTNITPDLLEVIINRGKWSPTRVLGTVERLTDEDQQAEALLRIVESRADPHSLPEALVADAWAIALALRGNRGCRAIAALIPRLPNDLLDGAVQAVAERAQESDVLAAAAALVDRLAEGRLNNFPWFAMPTMYYEQKMVVSSLVNLKCGYPEAADRALEYLVDDVDNEFIRCQYLAKLIPRLPATAFDRAMAVLAKCPARYRSDALLALVRHAPDDRLTDVLKLASAVRWENTPPEAEQHPWQRMMQVIGRRLAGSDQEARANQEAGALAVAHALRVDRSAEAIEVLAPYLTGGSARQALQDIEADLFQWKQVGGAKSLMIAVGALAKRLPSADAKTVVERNVKKYCHVDDELRVVLQPGDNEPSFDEAELLAPAAAYLPRDTVRLTVRSICRGISLAADFATTLTPSLSRLAPTVAKDPTLVREAFDMVLKVSAGWRPASRLTVLSVLASDLDDDSLDEAIKLVLPGPIEAECFAAIAALGRERPKDQRTAVARRALNAALEIASDTQRTCAIAGLAPTLPADPADPADLAKEALELVGSVTHSVLYPSVLSALDNLAPRLPKTALSRALQIFIDTPMGKIHDATRLFERLGRDDPTAIRNLFQRWPQEDARPKDSWLWALAPFLTESLAEEALAMARALPVDYARRLSMAALAPRLPDGLRAAVAHEVLELLDVPPDDVSIRIAVLARLAAATVTDEVTAACQRLLSGLQPRDLTYDRWDALDELLMHLPTELVKMVLGFSTRLLPDERFRVIRTLAPRLPQRLRRDLVEALESVTAGTGNELKERARALIALATPLPNKDESNKDERHRILAAVLDHIVQRRWWDVFEPAFVELIPLLPPPSRSQAVSAAVRQYFDQYRLGDLGPLLSVLEGPELDLVFTEIDKVRDPHEKATATAAVLQRAGALADRSMLFRDLDVFGGLPPACTRTEMFAIVGASAWWIRQQGGDRAVAATIDALFDVSRWWR
jgi:hypothetical protein